MSRALPFRCAAAFALALLVPGPGPLSPAASASQAAAPQPDLAPALAAIEAAWAARDEAAWLALWGELDAEAREGEAFFVQSHFGSGTTSILLEPAQALADGSVRVGARVVTITEPRGRVEQWRLRLRPQEGGWRLVARDAGGSVDGLLHLSLDPAGYRADGLRLVLEDFELEMHQGTLFTTPASVGPTVLVFSGEGTVRVTPKPAAEREQLRAYSGQPQLVRKVKNAFVRLHPADLRRVLQPTRLEADVAAPRRVAAARAWYDRHVGRAFVLDAAIPGAPWWLLPGVGDAVVVFDGPKGPLTFAVSAGDPESISLFDRERRRQICMYPGSGGTLDYSEDDGRPIDVLHHDVEARVEPDGAIEAVARVRLRLLNPATSLRLRLDEALAVRSVESDAGGRHLFFRVRNQNGLLVSLGGLAGQTGELTLTVRYGGTLAAASIDREALQLGPVPSGANSLEEEVVIEPVAVYTNRTLWHPQGGDDDYATGRFTFSVPRERQVVMGGVREGQREADGRQLVRFRQDLPARYFSFAVGRLVEVAHRDAAGAVLEAMAVPRVRRSAQRSLDDAAAIVDFFAREFGPPPYPRIGLAVIEGYTPGGHSPPGLVLLQERPQLIRTPLPEDPANFSDVPGFFLAHELAHQWWGHGVAGRNYRERWISEGLAQYAAALWVRESRGEAAFRAVLGRMGRWAVKHSADGPISLGHRLGHVQQDARIYRAVVYDKGALVLHTLRNLVGEEPFRAALQALQRERRFQKIGTSDLRLALETASGRELGAWFDAYIHGTVIPTLGWRFHGASGERAARVEIATADLPGDAPVRVTWSTAGGDGEHVALLSREGGAIELPLRESPRRIDVNADWGVLAQSRKR